MEIFEEKALMIRLLEALHPGVKVYLFGSRARGTHRQSSDIDLALDAGRPLSLKEVSRARNILDALYLPEKIDVIDLWSVPVELKDTVLREGIVWKS